MSLRYFTTGQLYILSRRRFIVSFSPKFVITNNFDQQPLPVPTSALIVCNFIMASMNLGGRPKNAWNPSRLRKLIRLHELSNTKVQLIPEIFMREEGFKPW